MNKVIVVVFSLFFMAGTVLSQGYWSKRYAQVGTNNNVPQALAVNAGGSVFIGGGFDYAFGVKTSFFAQWNPQSGWDSLSGTFTGSSFPVSSVAAGNDGEVFVSGAFTGVGSMAKRGIVKWTGTQWDSVPGTYALPNFTYPSKIVYAGGVLYALGNFTKIGTLTDVKGIARWNGTQWDSMGSLRYTNSNSSVTNKAFTVTQDGRIYAATYSIDLFSKENVAIVKWNGTAWDTVATGLTGSASSATGGGTSYAHVNDIAVHGDTIYVVGAFSMAGNKIANCIARWNGTQWDSLGEGTTTELLNVEVDSIGRVYVSGARGPYKINNGNDAIGRWNGSKWEQLGTGIGKSQYGQSPRIHDMTISGSTLYLCGDFKEPGGIGSTGAVMYDIAASQWKAMLGKNTNGFSDGAVFAFHERSNGDVFVGGEFNFAGPTYARRLARWNGKTWDTVGTGSYKNSSTVYALSSDDSAVYVGGKFTSFNGVNSTGVIKWNGQSFVSMNGSGQPGSFSSDVRAMVKYGNDIIVAGSFTSAFGTFPSAVAVHSIVKWTGTKWDSLNGGITKGTSSGIVNAMAVNGSDLYVVGNFTSAGGVEASSVARWDGSQWHAVSGDQIRYNKNVGSANITAAAVVGNELYIAGKFDSIGTKPMWHLAKWNGSQWDSVSLGLKNNSSGITDMAVDKQGRLYIIGNFTSINGNSGYKYFARWNGSEWENLGTSTSSFQQSMMMAESDTKGNIYISGYFGYIDGYSSQNFAAYINDPGSLESVKRIGNSGSVGGFMLDQNYPNPFNPVTTIRFTLRSAGMTSVTVYDIIGREVATLVNEYMKAGSYEVRFDASQLSSGIYFYRLRTGDHADTKKMVLMR